MCFLNLTNSFRNAGRHLIGIDFHLYIEEEPINRLADNRFAFKNVALVSLSIHRLYNREKVKTAVLA
jgi:hypothetical protein